MPLWCSDVCSGASSSSKFLIIQWNVGKSAQPQCQIFIVPRRWILTILVNCWAFLLVPQTGFWLSFGSFLRETSPQLFDNSLWHSLNIHFPLRMNYNNCNHSWVFSSPGQHLSLCLLLLTFLVFVIKYRCYDTFIRLSQLLCLHGSGLCWPAHRWVTFLTTHVGHRVTSPRLSVREPIRDQDT